MRNFCRSPDAPTLSGLCLRVCPSMVFRGDFSRLLSLSFADPLGAPTLSGFGLRVGTSVVFMYSFPSLIYFFSPMFI